jgi:voltage-gated potassium channel Kch
MAPNSSFKQKFQYWFDNMMSRGIAAQIGLLAVFSLAIILVVSLFVKVIGLAPERGFLEVAWISLMRTLDAGTMGGDTGPWPYLLSMLVVTLGGVFVVSALIGVLSAGVEDKLAELRKGRSIVLEEGHTIILGWSPQVFTIVSELVIANENQKRPAIAILADRDKVEMEEEISARVADLKNSRVVCRSGSPIDPADLAIVRPQTARSIIILPQGDMPDASVVKAILALTHFHDGRAEPHHIVTQVRNARTLDVLKLVGTQDHVTPLLTGDLIARVTAQTSRQSGLSVVYTELLDFGGDEIYFSGLPGLDGKTYGEALSAFEESTVIGICKADGTVSLNPDMGTRFAPGDQVIAISADDDTIRLSELETMPADPAAIRSAREAAAPKPERALILGWNAAAPVILHELDHYVAPGSEARVVADEDPEEVRAQCAEVANQRMDVRRGDTTDRRLLDKLDVESFDHVIVLADHRQNVQQADARTMITLLHLRDISLRDETPFSIVSEMLDLRNRELIESAKVDDFIVSDHLVSLLTTQLAENPRLEAVFSDLFDPEGCEIYLKPMGDYVQTGMPVNFYTVVEAARRRGETAIGYRLLSEIKDAAKSYGIHTNPKKSEMVTFAEEDKIIVLAEN